MRAWVRACLCVCVCVCEFFSTPFRTRRYDCFLCHSCLPATRALAPSIVLFMIHGDFPFLTWNSSVIGMGEGEWVGVLCLPSGPTDIPSLHCMSTTTAVVAPRGVL